MHKSTGGTWVYVDEKKLLINNNDIFKANKIIFEAKIKS